MLYSLVHTIFLSFLVISCHGLKISPPAGGKRWHKRQATTSTARPSETTLTSPNTALPRGVNTCVCRLTPPFSQYNTITVTYTASGSADSTYTTTIASPTGTTPGTVEILTPIRLATTTITSGSVGYTSTVTTTDANGSATPIVVVDQPALCGNQGWQWGYARIPLVDHGFTNDFDFSTLQTATYSFTTGTTDYIGVNPGTGNLGNNGPYVGPQVNFYGQYTDSEGQASINHRAYFIPPVTGLYTFRIDYADDQVGIWLGASALRGYTNGNYIVEGSYGSGSRSVQLALNQYSCNPLRVIWVDGSAPGAFNITILDPSGTQLQNGDYVRDTCCGTPFTYSQFGNEA